MPSAASILRPSILAIAAALTTSCSLTLELNQCVSDEECGVTGQCLDGLCKENERVEITSHIVEDTVWTADNTYLLKDLVMVVAPATLTIEPGTRILAERRAGLVSLKGARLVAEGRRDAPIVFTSARPVGQRLAGDWAGLAMVGRAPTNRVDFNLRIDSEQDTSVGGSDEAWDCGTLRYVRVEFGGAELSNGRKALKGITLAGCGSDTTIEYVQTHLSDDDGIAVFGGSVDLRYAVSTRAQDDGLDVDTGWRGTAQFLAIQQDINSREGIEIENLAEDTDALPQTDARIYNFTIIGFNRDGDRQRGIYYKLGGLGTLSHGIVIGQDGAGLHIEGPESIAHANEGRVIVENTLFFNQGASGEEHFEPDVPGDESPSLGDYSAYQTAETGNRFGVDPGFADPYNLGNPTWIPAAEHTTDRDLVRPPEGFDPTAVYLGAFSPSAAPWTEGWTSYPLN
ncbi:hypothetical protein EA187_09775 [Lujinxingia sediminis]|uniref:Right-handed parallel beta-helix repeat-containing protein n=1 Tax=Lujinxingia sediminis TaxID=2480984 RepID=A0ABY0CUF9_9DELT|nr:hypothetical protein [Lujinxingia sediminis]RVU44819.1 hypothetical protein EA187_09775 [Lujinxingia sediminis]